MVFITELDTGRILPVTKHTPVGVGSSLLDPIVCLSDVPGPSKVTLGYSLSSPIGLYEQSWASFAVASRVFFNPFASLPYLVSCVFYSTRSDGMFTFTSPPRTFSVVS